MPPLIICEKPSVAQDVAKALLGSKAKRVGDHWEGPDAIVAFAVGHLVEQVDPDKYDERYKKWRYEDLPILPDHFRYQPRDARAGKALKGLHALMKRPDVERIVNACDAGREGELIFKLILETAPKAAREKPVQRAWFSSMTQSAIREAFDSLRDDEAMRPLEAAARARSEADWLVGMNATRAATTKAGSIRKVLSLGRVQTPTLALIVNRDLAIQAFVPEDYWEVEAGFATEGGGRYPGLWHEGSTTRLAAAAPAEAIAAAAAGQPGVIESLETKPHVEQPPLLYDLTTLQREANGRFGFSASRTLSAAQALYDQHKLLTYPRTNSRYLSGDMAGQLKSVASGVGAAAREYADAARYVLGLDRLPLGRVVNDTKVTDHHAIIPTEGDHDLAGLSRDERRVYDMVARRFLAVFHPPARFERTVVETRVGEHLFRSRGKVMIEAGWRAAYGETADAPAGADGAAPSGRAEDEAEQSLPPLEVGQRVACERAEAVAKRTKPPARYSEGTLLRAMETAGKLVEDDEAAEAMKDAGIGTPATRAATIERLVDAGYVERDGRALRATDKGVGLIRMLGDHVLTSPELTGRWEQRLNRIERGEERPEEFRREIDGFTREVVEWFADKERGDLRVERTPIAPCPTPGCGGQIVEYPKSYGCDSYHGKDDPGCGYTLWKQQNGRTITREQALEHIAAGRSSKDLEEEREVIGPCPTPGCGGEIIERTRSYGCTSWKSRSEPGCGYVIWKKVRGQKGEVDAETARGMVARGETNAAPPAAKEPLADCPTPGCGGQIVENSRAYGCTSWKSRKNPGCGFVVWKREKGHEVSREEAVARIEEARAAAARGVATEVAAPTA
ncbi:DNA topoisomerase 3 [Miltoncostaea marina]|uniref:DNA topoisomerase 3 n=1 Tax=Miltoncostaea marina TaxID=2843215 RepID=UPI001C3CE27C|nr:DNA topoisomerase 3 [Miltoncostaea marina]